MSESTGVPLPEGTGSPDFCSSPNSTNKGTRGTDHSQDTSLLPVTPHSRKRKAQSEAQKRFRDREKETKKKIRAQVVELQEEIDSLKQTIDNLRLTIDDLKQTIHNLEQKNENLQQKTEILQQEIRSLERRVEDLKAQKESVAEDVAHWRHTSNGLQRNMAALLQQSNPYSLRKGRHVSNGRIGQSSARGRMLNPSDQSGPEAHPFPLNVFQFPTAEGAKRRLMIAPVSPTGGTVPTSVHPLGPSSLQMIRYRNIGNQDTKTGRTSSPPTNLAGPWVNRNAESTSSRLD